MSTTTTPPPPPPDFRETTESGSAKDLEAVYDISVTVSAVLGKATMQVSQLSETWPRRRGRTRSPPG